METVPLTSALLWRVALVAALIDAPLLFIIAKWTPPELFRRLKWYLAGAAFVVYAVLWGAVGSVIFWETVYQAVFPAWFRWLLPLGMGLLYGALALAFWRVSLLASKWQALWFCLFGGLVSLIGHGIGMSRGLFRVPMLAKASPVPAFTFGIFEFIFYWCLIVGIGAAGRWLGLRLRKEES